MVKNYYAIVEYIKKYHQNIPYLLTPEGQDFQICINKLSGYTNNRFPICIPKSPNLRMEF